MSLGLLVIGALFLISAVRGSQGDLFGALQKDFTGSNNFLQWALALVLIGACGYVPRLKDFSIALLALVLVAIFLRKGTGFFDQLAGATGLNITTQGASS